MIKKVLLCLLILCLALWVFAYSKLALENHQYYEASESEKIQARAYLKDTLQAAPNGWRWSKFKSRDGILLRSGRINAENAKGTIIYVPGFTETLELSMDAIVSLYEAGYNVAGVEYRGQGGSYRPLDNPEKGYVESYDILADEVAQFTIANQQEGLPLLFYSVSKGAHITMRMAATKNISADAYALVVPMIQFKTAPYNYQHISLMATVFNSLGLGDMYAIGQSQWPPTKPVIFGQAHGCNSNPDTAQRQSALFTLEPKLRTRGITIKWIYETVRSTTELTNDGFMDKVSAPVKIFTAGDDRIVSTEAANTFCDNLNNCSIEHFDKARHCIHSESREQLDQIIREAVSHFDQSINE